jgi:hypothetical protein
MSTIRALGILAIVVLVVAPYLGLTALFAIRGYWAGFLFLFQWSMMEEMKPRSLPKSALGAATGIAIACVGAWLAPVVGQSAAAAIQLAVVAASVFLLIRQSAALFINAATMLFLTVMTVPQVASGARPLDMFIGLAAGVVFFGGLALAYTGVTRVRSPTLEASSGG